MSILIVDDSKLNISYLQGILERAGYSEILTADSALAALQILGIQDHTAPRRPADIDLILLDIVMPGMDGIAACREIKEHDVYSDLPIIFLTGNRTMFREAFNAGGMDFIEKGSPEFELLARVQSALKLKKEMDIRKNREIKMGRELQLAKHLQNSVLSPSITENSIGIHGKYIQSDEVSGDMFYWAKVGRNRYAVLLLDVSGHGLSAALISMSIRSLLDGLVGRLIEPQLVCEELNTKVLNLFKNSKQTVYFTAIYLLIDLESRLIQYFNAGHPPALALSEAGEIRQLGGTTIPIGIKKEIKGNVQSWKIDSPTKILLYTDGLIERPGLSIREAVANLGSYSQELRHLPNEEFVEQIARLAIHKTDDVCVISIDLAE
ncbi:PP2C family protein-serine/threonine phosphatase [Saccharibacillus kuerlensis]|uniref:Transcriptional regulator n=1 Tax=Saccharibacillus kuerlensis TaxID=459527 RepID=A0ABQ2L5C0_9BACL|nr:fused response regulator/phosphatase [Saccharibacillus kuerlensis]GGO01530.1 transcriptional regulator [Saccharibacillus kuerlensis]